MIDGRGKHMIKKKNKNFEMVKRFFSKNPDAMMIDCQKKTGLSAATVRTHVKRMLEEKV